MDLKPEKVPIKSWRIQTQIIHINACKLIWFNCYQPTDPQTVTFDDGELFEILSEIKNDNGQEYV